MGNEKVSSTGFYKKLYMASKRRIEKQHSSLERIMDSSSERPLDTGEAASSLN
jgi:hypothetical protein